MEGSIFANSDSHVRNCVQWKETHYALSFRLQSELNTPLLELIGLENEIKLAERELSDWTRPQPAQKNLLTLTDDVFIKAEPLGVVLIIGAWNYPWGLTLGPLIGAIAAGETARASELNLATNYISVS